MPKIKLVVWDLDNTLWDGSVYYSDKESVKLKLGTKEDLKELARVVRLVNARLNVQQGAPADVSTSASLRQSRS